MKNIKKVNNTKSVNNNNVLLALMFIIIIVLLIYIIFFNNGSGKTEFYYEALEFQNTISSYLGEKYAEVFKAYNTKNIIIGYNDDGAEIKNIDNTNLIPIADKDSVIENNDKKYYKLNNSNIKEILKIDIPSYSGIEWYICENGTLAVKLTGKPKWWNDSLDVFKIS